MKKPVRLSALVLAAAYSASALAQGDGANGSDATGRVTDIRIGDRGLQTRIAVFCEGECGAVQLEKDVFLLPGAADAFSLDFSDVNDRITKLAAAPGAGGARLKVDYSGSLDRAEVSDCAVGGRKAACLDFYFLENASVDVKDTQDQRSADAAAVSAPALRPSLRTSAVQTPRPGLREGPEDGKTFAGFSSPERFTPPQAPILAKVQPIEQTVDVAKPTFVATEPSKADDTYNYAKRIQHLLGKDLNAAFCTGAEQTLQDDAWALGAMVDVGLCAAARGDVVEAESILSRLLEYTPDNFEALVGKAVIAEIAGERGAASRYYQAALETPPPVEESARIVAAMAALD